MDAWLPIPLAWWGPLAAVLYGVICLAVENVFPFSRYALYARSGVRTKGAVPTFWAEGEPALIADYEEFHGIDPETIYPQHDDLQCSLEWPVREAQDWLRRHRLPEPPEDAARVEVRYGFRVLEVNDAGDLTESIIITATGTARRR
ncbi:MAG: hypothetical protein R3B72_23535 [Polyangiaceae bacterium]